MLQAGDPQIVSNEGLLIVTAGSEFDSIAVTQIRPQLLEAISSGTEDIVFDLSNTDFIDSSGMGLFIFCYKKLLAKEKRVGIVGLKGQPKSVIGLSQINKTVDVHDSIEAFAKSAT